ncbi:thermonuclease family protein [Gammaproteobacteria bacterium]|nr:thermonuclease family protein [Gammaproteobacteria bacterium]
MLNVKKYKRLVLSSGTAVGVLVLLFVTVVAVFLSKEDSQTDQNTTDISNQNTKLENRQKVDIGVIDGDTVDYGSIRFRLFGIDAPESNQPCTKNGSSYACGKASTEHLRFILNGATVLCEDVGSGGFNRRLGLCKADGEDISQIMVKNGWAFAYRKYSTKYIQDENFAKTHSLGMWAKNIELPSNWRNN